jgi:hypothetical protein
VHLVRNQVIRKKQPRVQGAPHPWNVASIMSVSLGDMHVRDMRQTVIHHKIDWTRGELTVIKIIYNYLKIKEFE